VTPFQSAACRLAPFALFVISASAPTGAAETSYPVFGILQVDPELQGTEFQLKGRETFEPIRQYKLIYTGDGPALQAVRDAKLQYEFDVPVIVYMGGFTTNPGGAAVIDRDYRGAVAMLDVATLADGVDAKGVELRVAMPEDRELPIKASTADTADPDDKSRYCFWIRVDEERMKVIAVDEETGRLTVERGFESKGAAHDQGAVVLAPVYLGSRDDLTAVRHSNSWPGGPDYLRYALDPASEEAQRFKADLIIELMQSGYDGAWLDTFQPSMFNLCDALGRRIRYFWDFRQGRRHDFESGVSALQEMLRGVRQRVKNAAGREPYLAANSCSSSYDRGGKELFSAPERPGLLDAYCFEDSYITPKAARVKGRKLNAAYHPVAPDRWLRNVNNQADAARSGLRGLCMMGPAGYVAAYINPSLPNYEQLMRFSWCSFLLTVTKERTTCFGLPFLITTRDDGIGFLPLPDLFSYPIGDPVDEGTIESLKVPCTNCYLRRFANGLVAVNPSAAGQTESVAIPDGYVDPKTREAVSQVDLDGGDAALLVKADG